MIIIRADASSKMGTGHVMRCLALAQAARSRDVPVAVLGRITVPWVLQRLASSGLDFVNLDTPIPGSEICNDLIDDLSSVSKNGWVVLDGYHFGFDCQKAVREAGYKLLVIDDYAHLAEYSCDILLNQNLGSEQLEYKGDIGTRLFGPQYALLRQEFVEARVQANCRVSPRIPHNILVNLGGGNFVEYLAQLAEGLCSPEMKDKTLRIICGSMAPTEIQRILRACPATVEILENVTDMPALLLDTDLCITAGGSTCWELCCLGVPFLTLVIADNQREIVKQLELLGIAPSFSTESLRFCLGRDSFSLVNQMNLVDGCGAGRCVEMLS